MDLSYLNFNYSDIQKHVPIGWQELKYALDNNIIKQNNIVEHAIFVLDEGILGYDIVLELAILNEYEDVKPYLSRLIALEEDEDEEFIKSKWLYLLLWVLYQKRNEYDNALEVVEEIYCDFDYPPSIANFVRYMPTDEPSLGSLEKNEARLYEKWKTYLQTEKQKYL